MKLLPEWYPHHSTWTTFPQNPETFFEYLEEAQDIFAYMVKLISEGEEVYINVDDENQKKKLLNKLEKYKTNIKNIHINLVKTNDAWHRDYGAFVISKDNKPYGLKFKFNGWGKKYPHELDDKAGEMLFKILGVPYQKLNIVLEGGSIETNGETLITTESCLLNKNRNPDLTKVDIENLLKTFFGVKSVLWLKDGIVGDDTDGHVDDITRFVNKDTIITAVETNKNDENFKPLQKNLKILESTKFKIITIPMPKPQYFDYPDFKNYRLPASYANFYITNRYVIVPIFDCPQDKEALEILQSVFVDKKVIGVYAYPIIIGLGAFHCLTMNVPYFKELR
jgi:agmatine deiminase